MTGRRRCSSSFLGASAGLVFAAAVLTSYSCSAQEIEDVAPLGCFENRSCEANAAQLRREIPLAFKGGYQAQRNVSFCLTDGCDGSIRPNRTLGCAWRLVILAGGDSKVDLTDISFLKTFCSARLDPTERALATAQAERIFRKVYDRAMPFVPWP